MTGDPGAYKDSFLSEARANLEVMNNALLEAEEARDKAKPLGEVFRATHTLKGLAAMMRLERMAALCHALEDALDAARRKKLSLGEGADSLFQAFDRLADGLRAFEDDAEEPDSSALVDRLRSLAKLAAEGAPLEAPDAEPANAPAKGPTLPVRIERLDILMNLTEELIVAKMRFDQLQASLRHPDLSAAVDSLDRLVSELQYQVTQARMVPIRLIFSRFPRLVRDLAKQQGKQVVLQQEGGDIELDRAVTDEISESLVHLLRNAVDHGIEAPAERGRKGKPPQGTIRVAAWRTKDSAVIEAKDDGAGLDLAAIRRAAESRGALPPGASAQDVIRALLSGVSTTHQVTAVSGRGLGLDIVRRKMLALGGAFSVSSEAGKGATFRIEVPLTLAVVKTLFVAVGGMTCAIPLANIERIVTIGREEVREALDREVAIVGGQDIRLLRLRRLFRLEPSDAPRFPVVVVGRESQKLGLVVDDLVETQEIVLKPLSRVLRESGPFAGSALTGAGQAVLVLDVTGMLLQRQAAGTPA